MFFSKGLNIILKMLALFNSYSHFLLISAIDVLQNSDLRKDFQ